jgi:hypothetical protein
MDFQRVLGMSDGTVFMVSSAVNKKKSHSLLNRSQVKVNLFEKIFLTLVTVSRWLDSALST